MTIKTFVIIEQGGRFLLIREAAKKWRGKWFLPGGKADLNENPIEAAKREVKEEAGCDVVIQGIVYIRYREKLFSKHLSLFYSAKITGGGIKTTADRHSLEVKWFSYDEIKSLPVRQKLLELLIHSQPEKAMPAENFKLYV